MEQQQKLSFEIDAVPLFVVSKRPTHLEVRMKSKVGRRHSVPHFDAEKKRKEILELRRLRISERLSHVHHVVEEQRLKNSADHEGLQKALSDNQNSAEKNRVEFLHLREQKFAHKVSRARHVAKETNARKEKLISQKKINLEKRMKNSDMRRHMLLKIPRSKLMDESAIEVELVRYRIAVGKIQTWWQRVLLRRLIQRFKLTNLHGEKVSTAKFEQIAPLLQNKRILETTSALLTHIKKMSIAGRSRKYKNPSRVFLSAILVIYHPDEIMPEMGEREVALKNAASAMLALFESVLADDFAKIAPFIEAWNAYHVMFEDWKKADTEKVLSFMFEHFMQLETLRASVSSSSGTSTEWQPQIDNQQKIIKDKVVRIGGKSALQRLIAGQREFRGDVSDSSDAEVLADSPNSRRRNDSVRGRSNLTSTTDNSVPATPAQEQAVSLGDVFSEFGSAMTNEALAHELIMNPDFELSSDPNSIEQKVRTMAKKAFFNKIREELEAKQFSWVTGIVTDIKKQILDMLTTKGKLFVEITESLDAQLIQQQVEKNVFDFTQFVDFVTTRMLQLCAPIRDAEIRHIKELPDIVSQLESILTILDDMKLDLANFRLRSLRPHLLKQASEYEQNKFKAALEAKAITLDKTAKWLEDASKKTEDEAAARNPEKVDIPDNRPRFDAIYFNALLSLFFSPEFHPREQLAETLMMDSDRILSYQNEAQAITVVASLLMLTKNFVPEIRDEVAALKKLKAGLFSLLQEANTTVPVLSAHIVENVNAVLSRFGKSATEQQEQMIAAMVDKTLSFKDTVYMLLNRRLMQSIRAHLVSGKLKKEAANSGLDGVQEELATLSTKIFLLAQYNREVFAQWYDEILSKITVA